MSESNEHETKILTPNWKSN